MLRLSAYSKRLPELFATRTPAGGKLRAALYRYVDWRYRRRALSTPAPAVPPAALRFRVHGDLDVDSFLESGRQCAEDIRAALAEVGEELGSFEHVLDFGCGCARTLRWLSPWAERSHLCGTDVDEEAIAWCRGTIDFAGFTVNGELPPLPYPDSRFDLIYAISVFTHLSEELQLQWLDELRRVTAPNGYVLVTLRGSYYLSDLTPEDLHELRKRGFVLSKMPTNVQKLFPDWYQLATHSEEYVRRRFGEFFDIVRHLPSAMDGCQDVVVLRSRSV
jgi:SAM-dependent methyltransferase